MKQLTKIKLINWHMFTNDTVDIKGNIVVTGQNASGKSTLLDAVQFLLTAGNTNFNKAANENGRRTLESYVRGKIGSENKQYLRQGIVVSHIALEIYDETNQTYQVLGAVLKSNSLGSNLNQSFYKVDSHLDDQWFFNENLINDYQGLKVALKAQQLDIDESNNKASRRRLFAQTLGVDLRYFEMVPKALAFKPINNLNDFIFSYLLNEKELNIDDIRNSIRSYHDLKNVLIETQHRHNMLEQIYLKKHDFDKKQADLRVYEVSGDLLNKQKYLFDIKTNQTALQDLSQKLVLAEREKLEVDNQLSKLREDLKRVEAEFKGDASYSTIERLQRDLDDLNRRLNTTVQAHTQFKKHYGVINSTLFNVLDIQLHGINASYNELVESIDRLHIEIERLKKDNLLKETHLTQAFKENRDSIMGVDTILNRLEKREVSYPKHVHSLLTYLSKHLSQHFGTPVKVSVFSDELEVLDETWRNALEGFLNTQRFNLIVEPKYYQEALSLYNSNDDLKQIHSVGLVDVDKLERFSSPLEGSLATKVSSLNKYATLYANYLMGTVMCVDNVLDLRLHKRAITKNVMIYSGYVASKTRESIYAIPYIGKSAIEMQLQHYNATKDQLLGVYRALEAQHTALKASQDLETTLSQHNPKPYLDAYFAYAKDKVEQAAVEAQLKELRSSSELLHLSQQQDILSKDVQTQELRREHLIGTIAVISGDMRINEQETRLTQDQLTTLEASIKTNFIDDTDLQLKSQDLIKDLEKRYPSHYEGAIRYFERNKQILSNQLTELEMELKSHMRDYESHTKLGLGIELESLDAYVKNYIDIKDIKLKEAINNMDDAETKSRDMFRESFISNLSSSIEDTRRMIKDINANLKSHKFGNTTYQFRIAGSNVKEFSGYYDILKRGESYFQEDLFTETMNAQDKQLMDVLFQKMSLSDDASKNEAELQKYTDYRNYMSYDIIIEAENGDITYFSKVSKEKSGGETQIPFYVIIAVSFEQIILKTRSEDSGCLVVFDEAFNNMDEERIEAMMKFYNQLNIQIMLAVPPNRFDAISNHVETILAVVNYDHTSYIQKFSTQDLS